MGGNQNNSDGMGLILIFFLIVGMGLWYMSSDGILHTSSNSGHTTDIYPDNSWDDIEEEWIDLDQITDEDYGTSDYSSSSDRDGDGVNDQTDILRNARAYLERDPYYESRYYENGYPDDNCGVCTDVVAFAMKWAGYDIMELLYEDVMSSRSSYDIEEPDKRIDFRRVKNLLTYFNRHANSLTTNIYDTDEWQGGDIVVWEDHIGIISERRNSDGIPYVLHHATNDQISHEEDILEDKGEIVGHFRISY